MSLDGEGFLDGKAAGRPLSSDGVEDHPLDDAGFGKGHAGASQSYYL